MKTKVFIYAVLAVSIVAGCARETYENPVEMADIIGVFIDNRDLFHCNMWVTLDQGFSINITEHNATQIIKYLFERFPY